ncbi:MAG: MAPEG family protein [Rhodoferax sp.]|nr:MAPEG family protein [Rhodoferax sp.]
MRDFTILTPIFALAAWTTAILVLTAVRRLRSGVSPREFALGESQKVPSTVSLANRNYMNLLELPVLFYVICILAFVTQTASGVAIQLAWAYVALRVVHSLIHVTYNAVLHRFVAFAFSNGVLIALWVVVGSAIFSRQGAA